MNTTSSIVNDENQVLETNLLSQYEVLQDGIRAVDLPFQFDKSDRTWYDKYGIEAVPLWVRRADGKLFDDRHFKGIFIDGKYRRIVSRYYILFPNQELDSFLRENAKRLGIEIRKTYQSHYGDAMYWELLSEDIKEQVEYADKGDVVRCGAVVRNSLGASVALGADIFTFRVWCENGAVARGNDMSFTLKHVGREYEKLFESFKKGIDEIMVKTQLMIEYYKKFALTRMNRRIAKELGKRIPVKHFPDCMAYDYRTHETILKREDNLWESFNQITESVWHNEKVGFANKSSIEQATHRVLINAVNGRYDQ